MRYTLLLAGAYNIIFGAWCVLFPNSWFELSGMTAPLYPMIWQSVGMIVGVYGIGYIVAASQPYRHWPIVLVGFLGKVFGPIGFAWALSQGTLPLSSAWITVTNDLIWLVPFAAILWGVARIKVGYAYRSPEPLSISEAAETYRLNTGETLAEASEKQELALVFLRHFGCTFTRQILRSLTDLEAEAERRGSRLVLVHMLQSGEEEHFLQSDIARISDHSCELYRAFGLGKGTFLELFGPRVWLRGMFALFSGCGVGHLAGDGLQMPGAFVFHRGQITQAQRGEDASAIPDLPSLFGEPATS